jgi:hypothetical protein
MSKDELLLSEIGYRKSGPFRVVLVPENEIHRFRDSSGFIWGAVNVVDRNWARELKEIETTGLGVVIIDQLPGGPTID